MRGQAVSLKKPWISVPKKSVIIKISLIFNNLWKSVIICGQKEVRGEKKSVDEIRDVITRNNSQ